MAENEEIDLSKARRWQTVVHAIRRGESLETVTSKVQDCLYKTLRSLANKYLHNEDTGHVTAR